MIIEIITAVLLGILLGTITGLTPGIHVNLVSALIVALSATFLLYVDPLFLIVTIISLALTHTFLDALPSIFLGAPDESQALGVLPGHRMLIKGKGYDAVKLTLIGSLFSLILSVIVFPFALIIIPFIYEPFTPFIGWTLVVIVIYMMATENTWRKRYWAFNIFMLSGFLGLLTLNLHMLDQPLFPLLSGLFGVSTLLLSLKDSQKIPKQKFSSDTPVESRICAKATAGAVVSGGLAGLLPGLGSSQAAVLAMNVLGKLGNEGFLLLVGGINTVNFVFSLATFYTIEKARNGAIAGVMEFISEITLAQLALFVAVCLIAGGIATILGLFLARKFARWMTRIPYRGLCIGIVVFIVGLTFLFDGVFGLAVLMTSTAVGILPAIFSIKRSLAMGCLLLPVIVYFL